MKLVVLIAMLATLAGCVATAPKVYSTAEEVRGAVTTEDTAFDASKRVVGPTLKVTPSGSRGWYLLRAFVDKKTGKSTVQAYASISWSGGSWRNYRSASFLGGQTVDALRINTDVNCTSYGCSFVEVVGVEIPSSLWSVGKPLQIRINGRTGPDVQLAFPQHYIEGFTDAVIAAGGKL